MEPGDDPEARIRELEQPLAHAARASEAPPSPAASSWTPTDPYSSVRPTRRLPWIMLAVLVVGLVCLPVAFLVGGAHHTAGNRVPIASSAAPSPPSPASVAPPGSPLAPTAAPGGDVHISGARQVRVVACRDSAVDVSGVDNRVTITGHCTHLTVSGIRNAVTVDATETIEASGFDNDITYRDGSPAVTTAGQGNVVHRG